MTLNRAHTTHGCPPVIFTECEQEQQSSSSNNSRKSLQRPTAAAKAKQRNNKAALNVRGTIKTERPLHSRSKTWREGKTKTFKTRRRERQKRRSLFKPEEKKANGESLFKSYWTWWDYTLLLPTSHNPLLGGPVTLTPEPHRSQHLTSRAPTCITPIVVESGIPTGMQLHRKVQRFPLFGGHSRAAGVIRLAR